MDLRSKIVRQKIEFELNTRLPGNWESEIRSNSSVIAFTNIDNDGTNRREYTWAIAELELAYSTDEVAKIIAGRAQTELAAETNSQKTMKNLLRFK